MFRSAIERLVSTWKEGSMKSGFSFAPRKHLASLKVRFTLFPLEHYTWSVYFLLFKIILLIPFVVDFICVVTVRYTYVCTSCMCPVPEGALELEWHPVVSCPVGSRIELGSSGIAVSTLSHWAIPLAPVIICCLRFEDVQSFLDCDTSFSEYVLNMLFMPCHLFLWISYHRCQSL